MILGSQHIVHGSGGVDGGQAGNGAFRHVDSHGNTVLIGHVGDLLHLQSTAAGKNVGVDHRDSAALDQRLKAFFQVNILTGADGDGGGIVQAHILVGVHPGDQILCPGQIVFLHAAAEADAAIRGYVTEMVHSQRHLIANDLTHLTHIFFQHIQAVLGDLNAGVRMGGGNDLVALLVLDHICRYGAALGVEDVGSVLLHVINKAQGGADRAGLIQQKTDAKVHLQEGEAHVHPLLQGQTHGVTALILAVHIGVTIDTDLVPVLTAQHLVQGDAPGLAGQIPQSDLNAADAAALTGGATELLDFVHEPVNITGILPQNAALEHEGIGLAGSITDLAVADETLVGVNFEQCAALGGTVDVHEAHIGDAQAGRVDFAVDTGHELFLPENI